MKVIKKLIKGSKTKTASLVKRVNHDIKLYPLRSFYITLLTLIILIILSNQLSKPPVSGRAPKPEPKKVKIFSIGTKPTITVSGIVDKSGVITIKAITNGIIAALNVTEGGQIARGTRLLTIATDYSGGNSFSTQRQLAQTQYQGVIDTLDSQKKGLEKQKEIASHAAENNDELTNITQQSINETKSLITLNEEVINSLDKNLGILAADPGTNADLILSTKQVKSQFLGVLNQTRATLRQSEYQTNQDKPPTKLSNLQKEVALLQLDAQLKMLDVNTRVSKLQVDLASTVENMTIPAAPLSGVVQKVYVKKGESVNPGSPLVLLSENPKDDPITVTALISRDIALKIDTGRTSIVSFFDHQVKLHPAFVSTEAVDGQLFAVYFTMPDQYASELSDGGSVDVKLSLKNPSNAPIGLIYIPIDAVWQTGDNAFIYLADKGTARSKKIILNHLDGDFVSVAGLTGNEKIILDRTVIDGTPIKLRK